MAPVKRIHFVGGCVALLVVAVLATGATLVPAADTVIGFEEYPAPIEITSQYHSPQGVDFSLGSGTAPRIRSVGVGVAHSGDRVLDFSGCAGEFCDVQPALKGFFADSPRTFVRVFVGDVAVSPESRDVRLDAYNTAGANVGSAGPVSVTSGAGFGTMLQVVRPSAEIKSFTVSAPTPIVSHLAVDDVTFDAYVTPPPPLPAPPSVTITSPTTGQRFASPPSPLHVTGTVSAPGGVAAFCVAGPIHQPGFPSSCAPGSAIGSGGTFDVALSGLGNGPNFVSAWVRDKAGQEAHQEVIVQVGLQTVVLGGIEVTQGVQWDLNNPPRSPPVATTDAGLPKPVTYVGPALYRGAKLVENRKTIVRVFANTLDGGPVTGAEVELTGLNADGKTLPGSPLSPEFAPPTVGPGPLYTAMSQRANPAGAFTFTLPPEWTHGTITLRASVSIPGLFPIAEVSTTAGTFTLQGIHFTRTNSLWVSPLRGKLTTQMADDVKIAKDGRTVCPAAPCPVDPFNAFDGMRAAMPIAQGQLFLPGPAKMILVCRYSGCSYDYAPGAFKSSYEGEIWLQGACDGESCPTAKEGTSQAMDKLGEFVEDSYGLGDRTALVVDGPTSLFSGLTEHDKDTADREEYPLSVVTPQEMVGTTEVDRPLTDVAHELGHTLGLPHAGQDCPGSRPDDGDQKGEPWVTDNRGLIQGVGLDPRSQSGPTAGAAGPYTIFAQGFTANGTPSAAKYWYDFMSYCGGDASLPVSGPDGNDSSAWISTTYWDKLVNGFASLATNRLRGFGAAGHATQAGGPVMLSVWADVGSSGKVAINPVGHPAGRAAVTDEVVPSDFHLVALDSAGRKLSDAPMETHVSHVDGFGLLLKMNALVPAAGVTALQVTRDGAVLATRRASSHKPRVRILAPRAGAHTGRARTTEIRFRASDADHESLLVKVDYSTDDGRLWRTVYIGPNRTRLLLASSFFGGSHRARVRVVANDGFNEGAAVSGRFTAAGWAPGVVITGPAAGHRQPNDAALVLSGEGSDDRFHPLRGRALRWFVGGRRVGSGNQVAVLGLRAGLARIRLVACDRLRRCSTVGTKVRLTQAVPRLLVLGHPRQLGRGVRQLHLRVASTVPAILTIGSRRFPVSRRVVAVTLHVRPGRTPLHLRLILSADGHRSAGKLDIPRG